MKLWEQLVEIFGFTARYEVVVTIALSCADVDSNTWGSDADKL